ncbi:hypothetical protein IscW_ISCW010624 [Ixodes scapularis]|uniref:Uncharacterized protein n=1 Tax=Ixodes scapularis TaxID=6945 RepID=B7Q7E4_IXOSC|nr:hypothetical protein IscW_ISCW010624 [Ixodes scapularis]|eukprot:XP_002403958.1 hypothetical protein IscW_ISCW010624 [Ixodes scapularis]
MHDSWGIVVVASCIDLETNSASTSKSDGATEETLQESGSHSFYSNANTDHNQPSYTYAAINLNPFATPDSSARADDNQQASSRSKTPNEPAQQEPAGQAFFHPTSFEFGQTINHAVTAGAPVSSASNLEQNRQVYGVLSRPDHGGYRAEATVQRGQGDSIRYYGYGGGGSPKGYNTQRAYAYEKVYPEKRYSTSHAVAYEKHYNDDDHSPGGSYRSSSYGPSRGGYGRSGGGYRPSGGGYGSASEGYGYPRSGYESQYDSNPAATSKDSAGGRPQMRSYVYKNPYDKSTMRVVEMRSGSPGASSSLSKIIANPGSMEGFVANLMRNAKDAFPF